MWYITLFYLMHFFWTVFVNKLFINLNDSLKSLYQFFIMLPYVISTGEREYQGFYAF